MQHGKASTYTNHKCRCDQCKQAWAVYLYAKNKARRQRRQARGVCIDCQRPATKGLRCALHAKAGSLRAQIGRRSRAVRRLLADV